MYLGFFFLPDFGDFRASERNTVLTGLIANDDLGVRNGNKVIEIKSSSEQRGVTVGVL